MSASPAYRMPCKEPDWAQSVPRGDWTRVPDPVFPHSYRYRNDDTGETVLVPAVWYTGLARDHAEWLRFCADEQDRSAERREADNKPWSPDEARHFRAAAAKLRADASVYGAHGNMITGHVEMPEPKPCDGSGASIAVEKAA